MKSILRTSLLAAVASAVILWVFFNHYFDARDAEIRELTALKAEMEARLAQREAMIARLGRSRRLAHLDVTSQRVDPTGRILESTIRFIELSDEGRELARRTYVIPGNVLFVDAWTAKFAYEDVSHGHPLRGKTIVLLRRVYSEQQAPIEGQPIDTPGGVPDGYAASEMSSFEQSIWKQFWQIASDPELAERLGIRIAQGEVVYKPVREGQSFELSVDASGGINLVPLRGGEKVLSQIVE